MKSQSKVWGLLGLMVFAIFLFTTSCTLAKIYGRGATPVMLNNPTQKVEVIKHFSVSKGIVFDFTSAFDASEMLAQILQETGCDAIINVGLEVKTTVGDYFLNLITLGLAQAKHLTVVGDAIRFQKGQDVENQSFEVIGESKNIKDLMELFMKMPDQEQMKHAVVKTDDGYLLVQYIY